MLRRQSEKLAFPWNNSYDHSILRPKFSTCFCPTRMEKDYLWDCCSFPAVMLGGHSPIHCSLSSIIRERWGEHRKPLIHTLWVQLLYEWQLKFRNLITQRQQQFREDAKRDKKIPFLCLISPAQIGNRDDPCTLELPHIMERSTTTTTTPLYHTAGIRKNKFFGTFWGNRWWKSGEILFCPLWW